MAILAVNTTTELNNALAFADPVSDVIEMATGFYDGWVFSGKTFTQPLIVRPALGATPTLDAPNFTNAQNIDLYGVTQTGGITFVNCDGIRLFDFPAGGGFMQFVSARNTVLDNCRLTGFIDLKPGNSAGTENHNTLFRGCVIDSNSDDIMQFGNVQGLSLIDNEFSGVTTTPGNTHTDCIQGLDYAGQANGNLPSSNIVIRGNWFHENAGSINMQTLFLGDGDYGKLSDPIIIEDNILQGGNFEWGIGLGTTSACVIRRNTLAQNIRIAFLAGVDPLEAGRLVWENNVAFAYKLNNIIQPNPGFGNIVMSVNSGDVGYHGNYYTAITDRQSGNPESLRPIPGSITDFGTGVGAEATIFQILEEGTSPPMAETFTYALEAVASNGTAVVNADGTGTYDPNVDYTGPDSFSYRKNSSLGGTGVGNIAVTVTSPPVSAPDGTVNIPANTQAVFDLKTL